MADEAMTDAAKTLEDELRGAIEVENANLAQQGLDSRFTVQPVPRSGRGCIARFRLHHSYANGVPISGTEIALTFSGRIELHHPRWSWSLEAADWPAVLNEISGLDSRRRPRVRKI